MEVVKRTKISKKCPKCKGHLELVMEQWEPFPGEGTFIGEVVYCKNKCGYELVVYDSWKDPLAPIGGPYVERPHGTLDDIA